MTIEYVNDIFEKINKTKSKAKKEELLREWGARHPYNLILSLNFSNLATLDLPSGAPPFKRDDETHPDLFKTTLAKEIRRLGAIMKTSFPKIDRARREHIFIQVLESIPPKEADVLLKAKDRQLEEMYPTITRELVGKCFPNYVIMAPETN